MISDDERAEREARIVATIEVTLPLQMLTLATSMERASQTMTHFIESARKNVEVERLQRLHDLEP